MASELKIGRASFFGEPLLDLLLVRERTPEEAPGGRSTRRARDRRARCGCRLLGGEHARARVAEVRGMRAVDPDAAVPDLAPLEGPAPADHASVRQPGDPPARLGGHAPGCLPGWRRSGRPRGARSGSRTRCPGSPHSRANRRPGAGRRSRGSPGRVGNRERAWSRPRFRSPPFGRDQRGTRREGGCGRTAGGRSRRRRGSPGPPTP